MVTGPELELMTPGEAARLLHVNRKTVTRRMQAGQLLFIRTPGRHRRYFRLQVEALAKGLELAPAQLEILRQAGGRQS